MENNKYIKGGSGKIRILVKIVLFIIVVISAFLGLKYFNNKSNQLNCGDPNNDGSNRIYQCPSGKIGKMPPDNYPCSGDSCTVTDCCVDDSTEDDDSSIRICQTPPPSVLNNYDISNRVEANLSMDHFDVTGIECNTVGGYVGTATANVCSSPQGHYTVTGCLSQVSDSDSGSGSQTSSEDGGSWRCNIPSEETVQTISQASGAPPVRTGYTNLPAKLPAVTGETEITGANCDNNYTLANGYNHPKYTCSYGDLYYTLSGCETTTCSRPEDMVSQANYNVQETDLSFNTFSVTASCRHSGTPNVTKCSEPGQPYILSGCHDITDQTFTSNSPDYCLLTGDVDLYNITADSGGVRCSQIGGVGDSINLECVGTAIREDNSVTPTARRLADITLSNEDVRRSVELSGCIQTYGSCIDSSGNSTYLTQQCNSPYNNCCGNNEYYVKSDVLCDQDTIPLGSSTIATEQDNPIIEAINACNGETLCSSIDMWVSEGNTYYQLNYPLNTDTTFSFEDRSAHSCYVKPDNLLDLDNYDCVGEYVCGSDCIGTYNVIIPEKGTGSCPNDDTTKTCDPGEGSCIDDGYSRHRGYICSNLGTSDALYGDEDRISCTDCENEAITACNNNNNCLGFDFFTDAGDSSPSYGLVIDQPSYGGSWPPDDWTNYSYPYASDSICYVNTDRTQ